MSILRNDCFVMSNILVKSHDLRPKVHKSSTLFFQISFIIFSNFIHLKSSEGNNPNMNLH